LTMSYIHHALKKAQKEKDARYRDYSGILSARKARKNPFLAKLLWWIFPSLVILFLAFTSYSWFHSRTKKDPPRSAPPSRQEAVSPRPQQVDHEQALYERARLFQKYGRLAEAKTLYKQILEKNPGYVGALNNLGVIYMNEKDYPAARLSFEKANLLKPDYVDPCYNLACVHALTGNPERSLAFLKKALTLDPSVREWAQNDSDLRSLWDLDAFKDLLAVDRTAQKGAGQELE